MKRIYYKLHYYYWYVMNRFFGRCNCCLAPSVIFLNGNIRGKKIEKLFLCCDCLDEYVAITTHLNAKERFRFYEKLKLDTSKISECFK